MITQKQTLFSIMLVFTLLPSCFTPSQSSSNTLEKADLITIEMNKEKEYIKCGQEYATLKNTKFQKQERIKLPMDHGRDLGLTQSRVNKINLCLEKTKLKFSVQKEFFKLPSGQSAYPYMDIYLFPKDHAGAGVVGPRPFEVCYGRIVPYYASIGKIEIVDDSSLYYLTFYTTNNGPQGKFFKTAVSSKLKKCITDVFN